MFYAGMAHADTADAYRVWAKFKKSLMKEGTTFDCSTKLVVHASSPRTAARHMADAWDPVPMYYKGNPNVFVVFPTKNDKGSMSIALFVEAYNYANVWVGNGGGVDANILLEYCEVTEVNGDYETDDFGEFGSDEYWQAVKDYREQNSQQWRLTRKVTRGRK